VKIRHHVTRHLETFSLRRNGYLGAFSRNSEHAEAAAHFAILF